MIFTQHAMQRMRERYISENDVARVLFYGQAYKDSKRKIKYIYGDLEVVYSHHLRGSITTVIKTEKEFSKQSRKKKRKEIRELIYSLNFVCGMALLRKAKRDMINLLVYPDDIKSALHGKNKKQYPQMSSYVCYKNKIQVWTTSNDTAIIAVQRI